MTPNDSIDAVVRECVAYLVRYATVHGVVNQDMLQEGFLGMWTSLRMFDASKSSLNAYVASFVLKRALSHMRRMKRRNQQHARHIVSDDDDVIQNYADSTTVVDLNTVGLNSEMRKILATLSPREVKVLQLRFGFDGEVEHTFEEIGNVFEVSRERARQIETKALKKLRCGARLSRLKPFVG